jgi:hypothetical protein
MKSVYGDPAYADVVKQMEKELAALRKQYKDDDSEPKFVPANPNAGKKKKAA